MKARARRLYAACFLVLGCGIGAATLAYFAAESAAPATTTYIIVDGQGHAVDPSTQRTYVRDLKRFGGSAAVLFDDFNRWFASLWQGTRLALTIAWSSIAASVVLLVLAWRADS